jgi:hypothetical protein
MGAVLCRRCAIEQSAILGSFKGQKYMRVELVGHSIRLLRRYRFRAQGYRSGLFRRATLHELQSRLRKRYHRKPHVPYQIVEREFHVK